MGQVRPADTGFRGPQVCKIVDITYRQLDYWARTELCTPSIQSAQGSGSQRLYSFQDLVELKLIKKLLEAGVSLQSVRKAMEYLRELGHDQSGITLVSDGSTIYARPSPDEIIDLLRRGQGVFAIAVDPVTDELRGSVRELRRKAEAESTRKPAPGRAHVSRRSGPAEDSNEIRRAHGGD
ncbi:MAG: MerR family transcriptional regulator [Actinomycetota bacterium]